MYTHTHTRTHAYTHTHTHTHIPSPLTQAATAWHCSPNPYGDVGVEVFNLGPGVLEVTQSVVHTVATVNRLPW